MNNARADSDTIIAPATAAGVGAIAIVRLSGSRAVALLDGCVRVAGQKGTVNTFPHRRLVLGTFVHPGRGEPIDEVMAVVMRAPHSFTGEDVVEIHCHGSPAVVARIIEALCRQGARPAQPGEFTRRAFLNGRIDLAQAEAVCDLVRSETTAAARLALRQLTGRLSERIEQVRQRLIDFAAETEARLDFPDEEIEPAAAKALQQLLDGARQELDNLRQQGRRGRLLREGARIVLVGRPNVGKSSLLNALLGRERALVSPHPGTTRDTIECTLDLQGIAVTLVDTAGWRAARDEIERMGVERTESEMAVADLLVWIIDGSAPLADEDRAIAERIAGLPTVPAVNKSDLPHAVDVAAIDKAGFGADDIVWVSARDRTGIESLEQRIVGRLLGREREESIESTLVSNARHLALLARSHEAVDAALRASAAGLSGDLIMVDVRRALAALDEILGKRFDEEMLDTIFARFCIGK